ncbi:MAG: hypothetical protein J6Y19_11435 [Kiritimatiellae bacterium]|nr:hypothetical protein [Kiritimatiellia bacterium]
MRRASQSPGSRGAGGRTRASPGRSVERSSATDRAEWVVEVPAGGEAGVSYSVMYSWM